MTLPLPQDNPQYWQGLLTKLEERCDAQEQVLAGIMQGYIELAVIVEQCLQYILEPMDEKARLAFAAATRRQQEETYRMMNKIAQQGNSDFERTVAESMANMATPSTFNLPGE